MSIKETLTTKLKLTEKEFLILASYGYTDQYSGGDVKQFQQLMLESMMEEEGMEDEYGPIWEGNDKNILINIFNR
jgi:serine/threonine protein phosphatase PrpC